MDHGSAHLPDERLDSASEEVRALPEPGPKIAGVLSMAVDNEGEHLTLIRSSEPGPDRIDVFGVIENGEVVFSVQVDVKQHDLIERPRPKVESKRIESSVSRATTSKFIEDV